MPRRGISALFEQKTKIIVFEIMFILVNFFNIKIKLMTLIR